MLDVECSPAFPPLLLFPRRRHQRRPQRLARRPDESPDLERRLYPDALAQDIDASSHCHRPFVVRLAEPPDRGRRAFELLQWEGFTTIWQKPDHEGLLLRHFAGHDHDDPARGRSMAALQAVWPGYHKNMAAADLQRQLMLEHITRAAGVTEELMALLRMLGLCRI